MKRKPSPFKVALIIGGGILFAYLAVKTGPALWWKP